MSLCSVGYALTNSDDSPSAGPSRILTFQLSTRSPLNSSWRCYVYQAYAAMFQCVNASQRLQENLTSEDCVPKPSIYRHVLITHVTLYNLENASARHAYQ